MSDKIYRIAWKAQLTRGNGPYCLSFDVASAWVKSLRRIYPHIKHWVEYESNSIPCRVPDYLVLGVGSSSLREERVRRLSLAHQRDTSRSPQF